MYPSLHVSTPAASLAATAGSAGAGTTGGGTASYGGGDGRAGIASGADGPLFPLLRVQVNSKLRVAPQVRCMRVSSVSGRDFGFKQNTKEGETVTPKGFVVFRSIGKETGKKKKKKNSTSTSTFSFLPSGHAPTDYRRLLFLLRGRLRPALGLRLRLRCREEGGRESSDGSGSSGGDNSES